MALQLKAKGRRGLCPERQAFFLLVNRNWGGLAFAAPAENKRRSWGATFRQSWHQNWRFWGIVAPPENTAESKASLLAGRGIRL